MMIPFRAILKAVAHVHVYGLDLRVGRKASLPKLPPDPALLHPSEWYPREGEKPKAQKLA